MPREHDRVPYRIETILESASGRREVRISDVGPGGCYIESITHVHQGETVSFDIVISPEQQIKFSGEVAYIFPGSGFGVKFMDMTDEKRDFIEHLIRSSEG
jgi:PilZ domain